MQARSESLHRWQCCGCKAIFLNEKNIKLHVAFQLKIEARAAAAGAAAAASAAAAAPASGAGAAARARPGPGLGRRIIGVGLVRPSRARGRPGGLNPRDCHWPGSGALSAGTGAAAAAARPDRAAKYQKIRIDQALAGPAPASGSRDGDPESGRGAGAAAARILVTVTPAGPPAPPSPPRQAPARDWESHPLEDHWPGQPDEVTVSPGQWQDRDSDDELEELGASEPGKR
jgi:hypothetical protein